MTKREEFERKAANGEILIKYLGVHVSVATRQNYIEEKRTETGYSSDYLNTGYEVFCAAWQAAKAQAVPESVTPKESMIPVKDDDFVLVPRGILGAACSAIYKKRDAPILLSKLRELSMSVGAMRAVTEAPQ